MASPVKAHTGNPPIMALVMEQRNGGERLARCVRMNG